MIKAVAVSLVVLTLIPCCINEADQRVENTGETSVSLNPGESVKDQEIQRVEIPKLSPENLKSEPMKRIIQETSEYCRYIGLETENGGYGGFVSILPDGTVTGGYEGDPPIEIICLMEKAADEKIDYYLNFSLLVSPDKYWFVKISIDRTEYLSWLEKRFAGVVNTPFTIVRESLPDDTVVDGLPLENMVLQKAAEAVYEETVGNF